MSMLANSLADGLSVARMGQGNAGNGGRFAGNSSKYVSTRGELGMLGQADRWRCSD